jgi:hypothetical protein
MNLLKGLIQAPFKMLKGLFQGIGKIFGFKNKEKNNTEVSSKNNKKGVLEKFLAVTKNLKRNNSEKKTEKKESKFVVTDKNGNVLNGNDNKEKGKGQGNKEIDVIQKELNDTKNQISDLKLKMNTKHGTYEIIIPNEMVQNAGNFNINLSDTKSLKEKAKKFGYDLDNKSQFQKALSALGITAKKVSKEKDSENNTEDNENNTKEISLKREQQNQFFKNSFADKNEAFNSQLFANKLPSTSAGASLGTGIALGEVVNLETSKKVKGGLEKLVTSAIGNKNSTQTLEKGKNVKTK